VRRSGGLRHTRRSAESCCRQALTRFTVPRCAGPDRRTRLQASTQHDSVSTFRGGVRERPNRHDWKSCVLHRTVGSNPTLSAAPGAGPIMVGPARPSWVSYAAQAALLGKRVVPVPIPVEAGGIPDAALLDEPLRAAATSGAHPGVLVLTVPDNPTGTVAGAEALQALGRPQPTSISIPTSHRIASRWRRDASRRAPSWPGRCSTRTTSPPCRVAPSATTATRSPSASPRASCTDPLPSND
jgi:hypothetical protein